MTKENAHLFLPLVRALGDGKTIQYNTTLDRWCDLNPNERTSFMADPARYRIKPEPVMVPLGPEDVPPGTALRAVNWDGIGWMIVARVMSYGLYLENCSTSQTWADLVGVWEIKRPGEDWQPCCKPASE